MVWVIKERTVQILHSTEIDFGGDLWELQEQTGSQTRKNPSDSGNVTSKADHSIKTRQSLRYGRVQRLGKKRLPKHILRWTTRERERRGMVRRGERGQLEGMRLMRKLKKGVSRKPVDGQELLKIRNWTTSKDVWTCINIMNVTSLRICRYADIRTRFALKAKLMKTQTLKKKNHI